MAARRTRTSVSVVMSGLERDHRVHAQGVPTDGHFEGMGVIPQGWEDCAWDYEQGNGYTTWLPYNDIDTFGDPDSYDWRRLLIDNGWEMPTYLDEMEDWDEAPIMGRWVARDWDFEPPPMPVPIMTDADRRNIVADVEARGWEEDRKAEAKRQRIADEEQERRKYINEERRNITAMKRAAKEQVLARIAEGNDGAFEVHVRKGNQTLKWEYEIRDGKAYIHLKSTGWVRLAERRGHAS